jgi:hypothetical protein
LLAAAIRKASRWRPDGYRRDLKAFFAGIKKPAEAGLCNTIQLPVGSHSWQWSIIPDPAAVLCCS